MTIALFLLHVIIKFYRSESRSGFIIRHEPRYKRVKLLVVSGSVQVRDFVQNDVVYVFKRLENEIQTEFQFFGFSVANAPFAAHFPHRKRRAFKCGKGFVVRDLLLQIIV